MSRVFNKGNAELHALVKEALCIKGNDHVLEIGFGTGKLLKEIADCEDVFQYYSTQDVTDLLAIDGSPNSVDIMVKKGKRRTCFCAVGAK
jgi:tRNA G46 methylase TrmB